MAAPLLALSSSDFRLQQLEARLARVEEALTELQRAPAHKADSNGEGAEIRSIRHLETLQKDLEDGYSVSSSELIQTQSERFEEALFTASGDEIRAGIATKGPCYELQHSVWDCCLFIGLPALSIWDSAMAAFLLLLNTFVQIGFVMVVRYHMLEDVLKPDQLTELLRFRTNVAHDVKYADLAGGRSMARQVCEQDESLQWGNAQSGVIGDLNDYCSVGPVLAMLAIGCWLSTTLRELFNITGFLGAISNFPVGDITELVTETDENGGETVKLARITEGRKVALYILVALPRLVVAGCLSFTGTCYLANTLSLADLILNAVALAFILDLDELVESAFMPRRTRFLLDAVGTLQIPRMNIPGIGVMRLGLQELVKTLMKLGLLILGLILSWFCLLMPLHERVTLALSILCSGKQDFIYTVNSATGLIEAAMTFEEDVPLSSQQKSVLRLTDMQLYPVDGWFKQHTIDKFLRDNDAALLHDTRDGQPSRYLLDQLLLLMKSDVAGAATSLPCSDMAFPRGLIRERLKSITNNTVENCTALAQHDEFCAVRELTSVRALCPETCGCDDPFGAAAGAFATVPFGCPVMCMPRREVAPELQKTPCADWSVEKLVANKYVHRLFEGLSALKLEHQEMRESSTFQYKSALNSSFYHLLPGPNRTAALETAADFYASGGWYRALAHGTYELGYGIPHPRGLTGCAFLDSEEVKIMTGGSLCTERTDVDLIVSLRPECPVTCGCKRGQRDCPGTCPLD